MPNQSDFRDENLPELTKFRSMFTDYYELVLQRATENKLLEEADSKMWKLYRGLGPNGQKLANAVLSEWLESEDVGRRFTAFGLIGEFKIVDAVPALKKFIDVHRRPRNAEERFDLSRATRALEQCKMVFSIGSEETNQ